ncbi:MAG: MobF family relaxase [Phycisphaerales bacterium]
MLRITQNSNGAGAKSYYSTADYYLEGQELAGMWRGKGAARLGLSGEINRAEWDRLCENRDPATGLPLTPRLKSDRRVGYDLSFHAPKSVSILYGFTQDERLLTAMREAVEETLADIEFEMKTRVRVKGTNHDRVTGNLVYGEFVHFTARPVDGIPDPHLHAHCFAFNTTYDETEKRWKAGQFADIKAQGEYFEAMFHSRLARKLEEIGLPTERRRKGWELAGVPSSAIRKLSRRTALIEEKAKALGITDPSSKSELGAKTRERKRKNLLLPELQERWHLMLTGDEIAAIGETAWQLGNDRIPEDTDLAREAVDRAIEHCFERASVVPLRVLQAEAIKRGIGKASAETISEELAKRDLLVGERFGQVLTTTKEVLAEERAMLDYARRGRGNCRPLATDATSYAFKREWLNSEQKAAVRHVLTSRDAIVLIRGKAGTGKTTMMQEARDAIEASGLRVFAFAPSAAASQVLEAEGFSEANTVARLIADPKMQEEVRGLWIWVDEAGLLGTKTMRELFEVAEHANARIVLSGDRRQHGSVERGAALRLLEEEAGLRPAEIKAIQRQREQYKAAVHALSEGNVRGGFERLDRLGWIREVDDDNRCDALAKEYVASIRSGKSALLISPTHAEGARLTTVVREALKQEKLLGARSCRYVSLVPLNFTVSERRDPLSYQLGDVLEFHQNAKGFRKSQRLVVGDVPLPLDQAERFSVFRPNSIELAPGDRLRITKNGTTENRKRLNNGDLVTLKGFTRRGELILTDGRVLASNFGHFTFGLAVTSHASQGKTVDNVFIWQPSTTFAAASRAQFYVSVSRARDKAMIFSDSKADLLEAVSHSDERLAATELVADMRAQERHAIRDRQAELERNLQAHEMPRAQDEMEHAR